MDDIKISGWRQVLIIIAVVLFLLAALGVTLGANVGFVALGLACFAAAHL